MQCRLCSAGQGRWKTAAPAGRSFYATGRGGGIFAYNASLGALDRRYAPGYTTSEHGIPYGPVTVAGDHILAVANDGLYALRR